GVERPIELAASRPKGEDGVLQREREHPRRVPDDIGVDPRPTEPLPPHATAVAVEGVDVARRVFRTDDDETVDRQHGAMEAELLAVLLDVVGPFEPTRLTVEGTEVPVAVRDEDVRPRNSGRH